MSKLNYDKLEQGALEEYFSKTTKSVREQIEARKLIAEAKARAAEAAQKIISEAYK